VSLVMPLSSFRIPVIGLGATMIPFERFAFRRSGFKNSSLRFHPKLTRRANARSAAHRPATANAGEKWRWLG
jgi:hypothetical protein